MAQIAPKSTEIIPAIAEMYRTNTINEFTIKRARNEANKLLNSGLLDGHIIHALIDSLLLDIDSFFEHFRVVKANTDEQTALINMSKCLLRLGYGTEGFQLTETLLTRYPDNINLLIFALGASLQAAKFSSFLDFMERLTKLGYKDFSSEELQIAGILKTTLQIMEESNISDDAFKDLVTVSQKIIRDNKIAFRGVNIESGRDGNISVRYGISADVETTVAVSFEIADNIVSSLDNTYYEILTIGCYSSK